MLKTDMHMWGKNKTTMIRIIFAIFLILIIFLGVGCRGRDWHRHGCGIYFPGSVEVNSYGNNIK